ncbi:MAG: nucleotidyltransferase domain-containing protein [archaeon]
MMKKYNINQTTLLILGLYKNNYATSLHLREIARQTHIDVKAVQLQLKKLEKLNVTKSIQKGRNKNYSLNLNNYLTKYYMILTETYATITYLDKNFEIKKLINEISDKIEDSALIFGSFAKNEMTSESDIDLLIISDIKPDLDAIQETGQLMDREINIKVTTKEKFLKGLQNNDPLILEIAANHIILKGIDIICNAMWLYYAKP